MGYAVTSESIVRCGKRLDVYERAVREVLASYADNTGKAWPSIPTIAQDSGVSRNKVIACLASLEAKGALRSLKTAGRATVYHLTEMPPVHSTDQSTACTSPQCGPVHTVDPTRPQRGLDQSIAWTTPVHSVDPKDPNEGSQEGSQEGSHLSDLPVRSPEPVETDEPKQPPVQTALTLAPPTEAERKATPIWQDAQTVCDLWNRWLPMQPRAKPDKTRNKVLAAALRHPDIGSDPDELSALLAWAAESPWHNGIRRPMTIAQWMARDHFETTVQAWFNAAGVARGAA